MKSDISERCVLRKQKIRDSLGIETKKASWVFCGEFPLREVLKGRRACREGWRDRAEGSTDQFKEGIDMLAVIISDEKKLLLERETATTIEELEIFSSAEDMAATDWYLEEKQ